VLLKPLHQCCRAGCRELTRSRFCPPHATEHAAKQAEQERQRGSPESRGYDSRWKRERAAFLQHHPWCITCQVTRNVHAPATVVDHIVPHRGNHDLMWNQENWQPLCRTHHSKKTAAKDGGFGNQRRRAR
jgi:5-methylcytosine-specific restriction enzyme A